MPTWSPTPNPASARWWAKRLAAASSSAKLRGRSSTTSAVRSGTASTACSNRSAMLNAMPQPPRGQSSGPGAVPPRRQSDTPSEFAATLAVHVPPANVGDGLVGQHDPPLRPDALDVVREDVADQEDVAGHVVVGRQLLGVALEVHEL